MSAGIESISFYSSHYYLDLKSLAAEYNLDHEKFYTGIGQEKMATPPPDEDIVTMAANAGFQALENVDKSKIDTLMFATESGIDQSKAAGIYVHSLLDLPENCRTVELKQACYSGAAALQMAVPYVIQNPDRKVLIVASDVARYGIGTTGEPTQGAGAVAMVISNDPKVMSIEPESGFYTNDVMDFWRPNYRSEALVDGKFSIKMYIKALEASCKMYAEKSGRDYHAFDYFCYHLPFSRMGEKAHAHTLTKNGQPKVFDQLEDSLVYNRLIGNTYTASLFVALTSLLDNNENDLSGKRVGLFSYGSGSVGEFFSGVISKGYKTFLKTNVHEKLLNSRVELTYEEYKAFFEFELAVDGSSFQIEKHETGHFRLAGIDAHKRIYEKV